MEEFEAGRSIELRALLVRAGGLCCALPLSSIVETLRPQPIKPLPGQAECVLGVALLRGSPTPVVALRRLLQGALDAPASRLVTLRLGGGRRVALLVDAVIGLQALPPGAAQALPPLLAGAVPGVLLELRVLDGELCAILDASRLLPEAARKTLGEAGLG